MSDHRTRREIILVPYPVPSAGSNEPVRPVKPLPYRHQRREAWRPAFRPPKTNAAVSLLRGIVQQEAALRQLLKPQPPAPR